MPTRRLQSLIVLAAVIVLALPGVTHAGDAPIFVVGNWGIGEIDGRIMFYLGKDRYLDTPIPAPPHGPRWDVAYNVLPSLFWEASRFGCTAVGITQHCSGPGPHDALLKSRRSLTAAPAAECQSVIPLNHSSRMKINRQFQDLHVPGGGSVDWVLKQHVDRDICLLYQQLAGYSSIMGDLYWGSVFALPYWEYLDWRELDDGDRVFLRDGCLVLLLAAAWEQIDGAGSFINQHIPACRAAIARVEADTPQTDKLLRTVRMALDAAAVGSDSGRELDELSAWVHVHYVRGYFERTAAEFRTNPYFGGSAAG